MNSFSRLIGFIKFFFSIFLNFLFLSNSLKQVEFLSVLLFVKEPQEEIFV